MEPPTEAQAATNAGWTGKPALLLAAVMLTAAAFGCSGSPPTPEPVVTVEAAPVRREAISQVITAEGVLFPLHQASLAPKITAPVRTFHVNRGDRVHRGELLAVLENRDLAAAVVAAKGSYEQAKAAYASTTAATLPEEIQTATLNVENTRTSLEAQQKLYDSESHLYRQGAIARKQLDATEVTLTAAKSAYASAEKHLKNLQATGESAQRQSAQGQLEAARGQYLGAAAQLGYTEIRSPIDGVLAERAVFPGDIAPAGKPLLIVMDTSKVVARLHIPQSEAAQLQLGDPASLMEPGLEPIAGKVTVLSPAVDPGSTTVEVWVEATNPGGRLPPGGTATVSITARTHQDALVIPASALLSGQNGESTVMTAGSDGRAHSVAVETGIREGSRVEIVHGLTAGEKVIVNGSYGLPDGSRIEIAHAGAGGGQAGGKRR